MTPSALASAIAALRARLGDVPPRSWIAAHLVLTLGYVAFALHVPVSVLASATHDDALFVSHGSQLLHLHWLGPYGNLTLAKGPGFSLILAANYLMGTPITLTLAVLYALASFLAVRALVRLGLNRWAGLAGYAVLLFHPALLPTRVIRDDICATLGLLAFAGVLLILDGGRTATRPRAAAVLYGASLGLLWITREDSVWILPGLLVVVGLAVVLARRDRAGLRRIGQLAAIYVAGAVVVVGAIAFGNLVVYGRFLVTDFTDPSFERALKVLNSVQAGAETPFVPVPAAKRAAAYAVSPAFAELRGNLEDPGNGWLSSGCAAMPASCGDFAGGWWAWALRDAVASRGYYASPSQAAQYFDRVSSEIAQACAGGSLACRSNPLPFMPNLPESQLQAIPGAVMRAVALVTVRADVHPSGPSLEPLDQLERDRQFLGNPLSTAAVSETLHPPAAGWPTTVIGLLAGIYGLFLPLLGVAGGLVLVARLLLAVRRRSSPPLVAIAAIGLWVLVASRIAVLVLVDVSSFPAVDQLYLSAAYPLYVLAGIASLAALRAPTVAGPAEHGEAAAGTEPG